MNGTKTLAITTTSLAVVAWAAPERLPSSLPPVPPYRFTQTTLYERYDGCYSITKRETKVQEVFPVEGKLLFRRLLMKDGQPVSDGKRAKEAQREAEFRQAVRQGIKPRKAEELGDLTTRFKTADLERAFTMREVGRETIRGRSCVVYRYEGRPGQKLHVGGQYQKFFDVAVDVVAGRIWLDAEEREPARLEVRLKKPAALMFGLLVYVKDVHMDVEWERLEPRVWWPKEADAFVDARYYLFNTFIMHGRAINQGFTRISPQPQTAQTGAPAPASSSSQ
jgi:hypothetical protein